MTHVVNDLPERIINTIFGERNNFTMKKTYIIGGIAAIVAILAIILFFLKAVLPFHILAWICVIPVFLLLFGYIATVIDLRKDKTRIPFSLTLPLLLALILIASGFLCTRTVSDALLLGCCFVCLLGVPLFLMALKDGKKAKPVDAKPKEPSKPSTSKVVPEEMFKESMNLDSFTIGEVFPWKEYAYPGDHVSPVLNAEGFDVVASFTDITEDEDEAFASSEIKVSLFVHNSVIPFIVFNYGDVARIQFSLNILKMKEGYRKLWIDNNDYNTVNVYLLEGRDATLVGIRRFSLNLMPEIRKAVAKELEFAQKGYLDKDTIDSEIKRVESIVSVPQMEQFASHSEIVPRPEIEL